MAIDVAIARAYAKDFARERESKVGPKPRSEPRTQAVRRTAAALAELRKTCHSRRQINELSGWAVQGTKAATNGPTFVVAGSLSVGATTENRLDQPAARCFLMRWLM